MHICTAEADGNFDLMVLNEKSENRHVIKIHPEGDMNVCNKFSQFQDIFPIIRRLRYYIQRTISAELLPVGNDIGMATFT